MEAKYFISFTQKIARAKDTASRLLGAKHVFLKPYLYWIETSKMAKTSERRTRRLVSILNVNNAAKFIVGQVKSIQKTVTADDQVVSQINLKRRLEQSQDASIIY